MPRVLEITLPAAKTDEVCRQVKAVPQLISLPIESDPHDRWPGKHVVISLRHAQNISWESQKVEVNLSRADIENSPEYDPASAAHGQAHPSLWMRSGRFR